MRHSVWLRLVLVSATALVALLALIQGWNWIRHRRTGPPAPRHLAILPFSSIGDCPKYLSDTLTVSLTSSLTQLERFHESLLVVPFHDLHAKNVAATDDARNIFGATHVVTGEVLCEGSSVHLVLNLVDAQTRRQIASRTIPAVREDLATLRDSSVRQQIEMLEIELLPADLRLMTAGGTSVAGASDLFAEGQAHLQRYDSGEEIEAAIERFEGAIKLDSAYGLAHAALGEAFWRKFRLTRDKGWLEKAERESERALKLNAQLPDAYVSLGVVHNETGRFERALQEFEQALRLNPRHAQAYRQQAWAYERLNRLDRAEASLRKAISLREQDWSGYNELGAFYYNHGRYQESAEQWDRVVKLAPGNKWGWNNLGSAFLAMNRGPNAIANFQRAVGIDPSYVSALSNLAVTLYREGRYVEAAEMYEKMIQPDDRGYRLRGNLAATYQKIPGKQAEAVRRFQEAVQIAEEKLRVNPRDSDVLSQLAVYYAELGNRARALQRLEPALAMASSRPDVCFRAAQVHERIGDRDQALKWLGKALEAGYPPESLERAPDLKGLRSDPRLAEIVRRSKKQ